jgi:predicted SAM-dependent methyltransferase
MISVTKKLNKEMIPFAVPVAAAVKHQLSRWRIRRLLKERNLISVEVGAGDKRGQGDWITMDISKTCDIYWDLRRGIPFPNERVKRIYSSHFLEHLSFKEAQQFLDECKRVLVPDGKFLVCVPNARIYIEAYAKRNSLDAKQFFGYEPAYNHTTRIDYVNYTAYMDGEHKYMFDEENLPYILESKGFKNVRLRQFDPSLDLQERDFESIYAEAEK